jgi:hypothetical protein
MGVLCMTIKSILKLSNFLKFWVYFVRNFLKLSIFLCNDKKLVSFFSMVIQRNLCTWKGGST